jgi:hypothetical protein
VTGPSGLERGLWAGAERRPVERIAVLCLFLLAAATAHADDVGQCRANGGTYLTGTVTAPPVFAPGHAHPHGVELSHTHLTLLADQDGQNYDVAIDNVFASGYDAAGESVPAPLSTIRAGDRLELCGKLYASGGPGIDWVHTDCGDTPSADQPDGWVKIVAADGTPGLNLEASQEYCRLWR